MHRFGLVALDWRDGRTKRLQNIVDAANQRHAVADQVVAAFTGQAVDAAGNSEDFATLFHRMAGRVQGAARAGGLDNDHAERQAADNAVPLRKQAGDRLLVEWRLADDGAAFGNLCRQLLVLGRIDLGQSGGGDRDRPTAGLERAAMRGSIDAARQAADHRDPRAGQARGEPLGLLPAIDGTTPRADDGHGQLVAGFESSATIQNGGRVANFGEHPRIFAGSFQQQLHTGLSAAFEFLKGRRRIAMRGNGG